MRFFIFTFSFYQDLKSSIIGKPNFFTPSLLCIPRKNCLTMITLWRCEHPEENWLCLCCKEVLCSRFVNKHMLEHFREKHHDLALSYRFFDKSLPVSFPTAISFSSYVCIDWSSTLVFIIWNSDLSVWCFSCDSYLDAQVILQLRPAYETAYLLKFGQPPPFRAVGHSPTSN